MNHLIYGNFIRIGYLRLYFRRSRYNNGDFWVYYNGSLIGHYDFCKACQTMTSIIKREVYER